MFYSLGGAFGRREIAVIGHKDKTPTEFNNLLKAKAQGSKGALTKAHGVVFFLRDIVTSNQLG